MTNKALVWSGLLKKRICAQIGSWEGLHPCELETLDLSIERGDVEPDDRNGFNFVSQICSILMNA